MHAFLGHPEIHKCPLFETFDTNFIAHTVKSVRPNFIDSSPEEHCMSVFVENWTKESPNDLIKTTEAGPNAQQTEALISTKPTLLPKPL